MTLMQVNCNFVLFKCLFVSFTKALTMYGCYWNDQRDILSYHWSVTTTVECIENCMSNNSSNRYAGTQTDPSECFCGEKLNNKVISQPHSFSFSISMCKAPCPTSLTSICGISNRLAVFELSNLTIPVELHGNGESTTKTVTRTMSIDETTESPVNMPSSSLSHAVSTDIETSTNNGYTQLILNRTFPASSSSSSNNTIFTESVEDDTTAAMLTFTDKIIETTESLTAETEGNNCQCTYCGKWSFLNGLNLTAEELKIYLKNDLDEIQKDIKIDIKMTSLYKNSKKSANDDRQSSTVIGYFGGLLICIPLLLLVLCDICNICKVNKGKRRISK